MISNTDSLKVTRPPPQVVMAVLRRSPPSYWKVQYQTEQGKAMTNAWFDGYSHGALAAEADGVADLNRIVTRGGRHDDGHQMMLPAEQGGMPTEMTPADAAEDYSLPPPPVVLSPSL